MTIRWGIAGPGRIAEIVAAEFALVPDAELVAVGSRSAQRAEQFAERFGIAQAYGSYAELFAAEVDAIYLATPHAQHTELALAAIKAGKALLIEKSFTTSVADTTAIIEAARAKGVFVMEAMWTRFLPAITHLRELVASGALGEVRAVYGDLLAFRTYDPADRLFNPELGGGAVLDLGVYVISFVQQFLGTPEVVHAVGGRFPNGVESGAGILLGYPGGRYANQSIDFTAPGPGRQVVAGTLGWVEVKPRFHRASELVVQLTGAERQELSFTNTGAGYTHEIAHVNSCLAAGLTESPVLPLADTLDVQQVMAAVLASLGR
ncbi:Gfo/Idh/MocA family oxidoreductase [Propionicimonas sp.]|uniref:Gfo/Idh/MocA family protein n=1 Tax=Propionicimonas sp. TaxID=1955623 RepID=UPI0017955B54|nr:Gfo/Idh/MocA family oxidoreductase [Propionicimonas sp.]MBU3975659.1 Gfo/Idh/MocA family oxidoreductase [Actinomycetota bacterium]MBA3019938.1 Gfo/Idh/MocA family oxidoreductase [Propionicimonas sp.]MBU3986192.1 Gfo/Idh/MocA family oxidoreductase [Actinomycetota bacterium]MBU4007761.1 Gfo/Idh/MocA family oxidoreductase [Actinomycetota bacterium]MBU4064019.1 Gfo/Idh/MocA family oxidoreductase [Actinomycetota bacterium]